MEFKSTLRLNLQTEKRDKRMGDAALTAIAAFMNTNGGTLIIGVADDRSPVGIHRDGFGSEDSMSLHLRNLVTHSMGSVAMTGIRIEYHGYRSARVMAVRCDSFDKAVYVKDGGVDRFYVRTGPSSAELSTREAVSYIRDRGM